MKSIRHHIRMIGHALGLLYVPELDALDCPVQDKPKKKKVFRPASIPAGMSWTENLGVPTIAQDTDNGISWDKPRTVQDMTAVPTQDEIDFASVVAYRLGLPFDPEKYGHIRPFVRTGQKQRRAVTAIGEDGYGEKTVKNYWRIVKIANGISPIPPTLLPVGEGAEEKQAEKGAMPHENVIK